MTIVLGQQCGSDCDRCCQCGPWCLDGACGDTLGHQATFSGAGSAGGDCATCGDLNVTVQWSQFIAPITAEEYNTARENFELDNGVEYPGGEAKAGTMVCSWLQDEEATACAGNPEQAQFGNGTMQVYYGTDDKWHRAILGTFNGRDSALGGGSASAVYGGDTLLGGDGAAQQCVNEDQEDDTPTFSDSAALEWLYTIGFAPGVEPTWQDCTPPTDVLFENIPGANA